ncbi:hypothetical protein AHA02nite_14810 [Alkalibacillus haloalkaliphilus]|uniref:Uncharacterized protein n=2 Tax=Alkalibacillus haloalkaliphilus TaxID=94136 RepID=A0A511W3N3_9BACI|nr:hypothetical protein AHA02nite_14810 [Alkalibacillus haloalkaliphilus]
MRESKMDVNKKTLKKSLTFFIPAVIIAGAVLYYVYILTPKNSVEMYQELRFADSFDEVQSLSVEGYEEYFSEEEFNYIQENRVNRVGQFTLFEYNSKSYVIMTSPGTERLEVLSVNELPEEIREFFLELPK